MAIAPIQSSIAALPALKPSETNPAPATTGVFENALNGVSEALVEADVLSRQLATGQLSDLSQLTAATAKAELAVELTVAFRDRAVQSFQQIMNMQI